MYNDDDGHSSWYRTDLTRSLAQKAKVAADAAFEELQTACSDSDDAEVRSAYVRFIERAEFARLFHPGGKR